MQAGVVSDGSVSVIGFLFLPSEFADESTYGYRWYSSDVVSVRVIAAPGSDGTCDGGNLETSVTLANALNKVVLTAGLISLSSILF